MYKVFGYNDICQDFEFSFDGFIKAFKEAKRLHWCVVFIQREKPGTCIAANMRI